MLKRVFTNWWVLSLGTLLLVMALVLFGLPLFVDWLRPWLTRLLIGLGLMSVWGLIAFLRWRKAGKAEAALAAELAGPNRADEEAGVVADRLREALKKLQESSGKSRNYLYSRPWYVIIGPPGAGKTTALLKSGLRFPVTDQSMGGSGGTRNLDFLFADEAVLLDTAGRYTSQDSDSEVDRKGWASLLAMLRKHRPLESINGIFVALPADELLRGDVVAIDRHAVIVRDRLREIRQNLETKLPVYLLLTKSDLIAGFGEYFADLDVDGRRAVLGHSFAWGEPIDSAAMVRAFDSLTNQVSARQAVRLNEESDIRRRSMILGFPTQLRELRAPLHRFIEGAFLAEDRPSGVLRGFYLTSGVQDGAPLDRILRTVSQTYKADNPADPAGAGAGGRAFFLNRLLHDVVFKEAGLPIEDRAAQSRRRTQLILACSVIGIAGFALIALMTGSFLGNRGFQSDTLVAARAVEDEMRATRVDLTNVGLSDAPLEDLVGLLDELRDLPEGYEAQKAGGPSIFRRFGLFQSDLAARNTEAYRNGLRRILLPRLLLRSEDVLREKMGEPLRLYEPLKTYLSLGGAAPPEAFDAKAVARWVERDWASNTLTGAEMRPARDRLSLHLEALLEDRALSASWKDGRAPLDAALITSARSNLAQLSLADRAYAIMVEKAVKPDGDWRMETILQQGESVAFANPDLVMSQNVPHFFTRDGFTKSYLRRLTTIDADLKSELWVLGENAETASIQREMGNLRAGISARYASDYIAAWEAVVNAMQPADYFNNPDAYRAFTKAPSPLKKVLEQVKSNTTFEGGALKEAGKMAAQKAQNTKVGRIAGKLGGNMQVGGLSADAEIAGHFRELNQWVGKGDSAPIDRFVETIRTAFNAVLVARAPGSMSGGDALAQAMAPVTQAALEVPGLMVGFANQVASGGSAVQLSAAQSELSVAWQRDALPACEAAVQDRYPFAAAATTDAGISEVRAAFGPGGRIDNFVTTRLALYMDQGGTYWRWKSDDPVAQAFSPSAPEAFQKAQRLRDVLGEGLEMELKLADKGPDVTRIEVRTGGLNMAFGRPRDDAQQSVLWLLGGGMARSSEILIYGDDDEVIWRHRKDGPWALFRVLDQASIRNDGEGRVEAVFNRGSGRAVFSVSFPPDANPFGGGGLWSVRCPASI